MASKSKAKSAAGPAAAAGAGAKRRAGAGARPLLQPKKQRVDSNTTAAAPTAVAAVRKPATKPIAAAAATGKAAKGKAATKRKAPRVKAAAAALEQDEDEADEKAVATHDAEDDEERDLQTQLDAIMAADDDGEPNGSAGGDDEGDDGPATIAEATGGAAFDRLAHSSASAHANGDGDGDGDDAGAEDEESDFSDIEFGEGEEVAGPNDAPPIAPGKMKELEAFIQLAQQQITQKRKQKPKSAKSAAAAAASSSSSSSSSSSAAAALRAVVYIGHIPHGFYENEMKSFFEQFGTVLNLRLARNKKTGKSKHFAFIEFDDAIAAEVVAATMNGYMMFGRTLVVQLLPQHKIHPALFRGANSKFKVVPWTRIAAKAHNATRSADQQKRRIQRIVKAEDKKKARLKALGIDYEFPGYRSELPAQATHKKFDS